jgi:hypothetical protein
LRRELMMPGTDFCHDGRAKTLDTPPPVAPPSERHVTSDTQVPVLDTLRLVPPIAAKCGPLAGADAVFVPVPHESAPLSPVEAWKVMPLLAPCSAMLSQALASVGKAISHPPKLEFAVSTIFCETSLLYASVMYLLFEKLGNSETRTRTAPCPVHWRPPLRRRGSSRASRT